MQESKVSIINEYGEKLVGLETVPSEKQKKYPTVTLIHGFNATKEEGGMFDGLAKNLGDAGFLVYRFDFSGSGESEGDYNETSLSKLKSDLGKILKFVKSQPRVDAERIGILGQSLGTATTVTLEPKLQALILMSSVAYPYETLKRLFGDGYNPQGVSTRTKRDGVIVKMGQQFWKDFENHNLLESIKRIRCPILFIHGSEDDKTPLSEMEAYYVAANSPKEKFILEGADHGLRPHREKMYKKAVEWFSKHLK